MKVQDMAEKVQDYLDENDWKYDISYNDERPSIVAGLTIGGKLQTVKLGMNFGNDGYTVRALVPIKADEASRPEVMKYVTKANYGTRNGCFEMDLRDGEVTYRVFIPARHLTELPAETIEESISLPAMMVKRYGDGLAALMMGFSDADTEITKVEG